jgi:predicted RNA-binding protein with PUA-like domain
MAYWLVKSEPDAWSWDQQVKAGAKGAEWTGVRNHTAKLNLMKMKKGDRAFFYHSNEGKNIVGIVEIIREQHPDPTAKAGEPWVVVDVKALEPVPKPVSLDDVKKEPKLKDMALIKFSRLSVQPVTADEWKLVCKMGGVRA